MSCRGRGSLLLFNTWLLCIRSQSHTQIELEQHSLYERKSEDGSMTIATCKLCIRSRPHTQIELKQHSLFESQKTVVWPLPRAYNASGHNLTPWSSLNSTHCMRIKSDDIGKWPFPHAYYVPDHNLTLRSSLYSTHCIRIKSNDIGKWPLPRANYVPDRSLTLRLDLSSTHRTGVIFFSRKTAMHTI